jgi:hypothetical protein
MLSDLGVAMSSSTLPFKELVIWRAVQVLLVAVGTVLVGLLIFLPGYGLDLFWNFLIPVAPALIVLVPGVWRNICPMATVGLLPRHLGFSQRRPMPQTVRTILIVVGFAALLLVVPLRHAWLNFSGPATATMLLIACVVAFGLGARYEWRSAWCSSLCPIHPVEKLYGTVPLVTVSNSQCLSCEKCVAPCSDSTRTMTPLVTNNEKTEKRVGLLMTGGFWGYVYGWYQVPDFFMPMSLQDWIVLFAWPFIGGVVSLLVFNVMLKKTDKSSRKYLIRFFAFGAVATYYWYRLPMLFGYSEIPTNGMLVDLTTTMPVWFHDLMQLSTTVFFFWFMLLRNPSLSWSRRPAYSGT